jgi:hypothetical protein
MMLQMGHGIIMADRMAQAGALRPDVPTTIADYGDEQVGQYQMTGAGHDDVANGTWYHNGRQDGSSRCIPTRCNNYRSRLWRREGEPISDDGCSAQRLCKWDTVS